MYAAVGGHTDVVQVLLSQQDVDINMKEKHVYSPTYIPDIYLSVTSL